LIPVVAVRQPAVVVRHQAVALTIWTMKSRSRTRSIQRSLFVKAHLLPYLK
jgi:hypothetical protein